MDRPMRAAGDRVDRYVIVGLLGRGGMGEVYEAEDPQLERHVALKLLRSQEGTEGASRMLREARVLAQFSHPNAVVVYECDKLEDTGEMFLTMELVRGKTLRAALADGPPPIETVRAWLIDVARALASAHRAGIIHRDIKPDNVMLRDDGVVKVLDFGIAKRAVVTLDPSAPTAHEGLVTLTERGTLVGTPHYASPEQLRGDPLDGKTDQFSWGAMAYELFTGQHPFGEGDAIAVLSRVLSTTPRGVGLLRTDLPEPIAAVVMRALSRDAADRFASMDDVAEALGATRSATTSFAPAAQVEPPGPMTARVVARRAGRIAVWIAAAIGVAVVGLLIFAAATGTFVYNITTARSATSASAPVAATTVARFTCTSAEGADLGPLADAIGVGACMRLATALGLPWSREPGGTTVTVRATGGAETSVTLRAGDAEASGKGPSFVAAIGVAVEAAAARFAPRAVNASDHEKWGAEDDATTLAIERAWRRMAIRETEEPELLALAKRAPTSPWPPLMLMLVSPSGTATWKAALADAKKNAPNLSGPFEKTVLGILMTQESGGVPTEGLRLMRRANAEASTDPDIASLYGAFAIAVGSHDEGFAQVDRVAKDQPAFAILGLRNVFSAPHARDDARNERYLQRLGAILPEELYSPLAMRHALEIRDFARAEEVLVQGKRYFGAVFSVAAEAELKLASLQTDAARDIARIALGDAGPTMRARAGQLLIASHVLDGHSKEAEAAIDNEIARLHDSQLDVHADFVALMAARFARRIGRPMTSVAAARLEDAVKAARMTRPNLVYAGVELALSRRPNKAEAEAALAALETSVSGGDASKVDSDSLRLLLLPLVRAARGDAAAIETWKAAEMADDSVRALVALDAAFAMRAEAKLPTFRLLLRAGSLPNLVNAPLDWLYARRLILDLENEKPTADRKKVAARTFVLGAEFAAARDDLTRASVRFDESFAKLLLPLPAKP